MDKEPETDKGKIAEIVISLWSLCVAGIVIGLIAGLPITNALSNATAHLSRPTIPKRVFLAVKASKIIPAIR